MHKKAISAVVIMISLGGCSDLTSTQQRTMTGGLGGAAGGAVIGALAGNAGMGALIGAGAGAAGGYLYDRHKQSEQQAYNRGVQTGRSQAAR
ncbi:YMGG-like glycine zipper-containing protein [Dankookia sp. P2]|uniref:YMGG-like glycine zipper-containing protein n=1 Tax=Dankookia sp. P2 TaxID=3423955 RepID=UPI003D666751